MFRPNPHWANLGHVSVLEPFSVACKKNMLTGQSEKAPTSDWRKRFVPSEVYTNSVRKVGPQRKIQGAEPKEGM